MNYPQLSTMKPCNALRIQIQNATNALELSQLLAQLQALIVETEDKIEQLSYEKV